MAASTAYAHTVNQALNLAFADREQYIGDPAFVDVPMQELLSEAYLRERRRLIYLDSACVGHACLLPGYPRHGRATLPGAPQSPAEAAAAAGTAGQEAAGTSYFGVRPARQHLFLYAQ